MIVVILVFYLFAAASATVGGLCFFAVQYQRDETRAIYAAQTDGLCPEDTPIATTIVALLASLTLGLGWLPAFILWTLIKVGPPPFGGRRKQKPGASLEEAIRADIERAL